jgi:hypothetical protein
MKSVGPAGVHANKRKYTALIYIWPGMHIKEVMNKYILLIVNIQHSYQICTN